MAMSQAVAGEMTMEGHFRHHGQGCTLAALDACETFVTSASIKKKIYADFYDWQIPMDLAAAVCQG